MWTIGIIFIAILLLWKLASIWHGARTNPSAATSDADTDSSEHQNSSPNQGDFNHEIEMVNLEEEHQVVNPPPVMTSTSQSDFNHEIEEMVDSEEERVVDPPPVMTSTNQSNFNHGIEEMVNPEEQHVVDPPPVMTSTNQSGFNHEIEEMNSSEEEEGRVVDPPPLMTSTTSTSTTSTGFNGSNTWYAWSYSKCTIMACLGGLVVGYLTSATGGILALPQYMVMISRDIYKRQVKSYQDDFCFYRNQWLLLHSSAINVMAIIGILISSVSIRWGRRQLLKISAILLVWGVCCMSWFPDIYVEVTGLLLVGAGVGLIYHVIPIIYKETIPEEIQMVVFDWAIPSGSILALGINYIAAHFHIWGWRVMFGVTTIPVVFLLYISFVMLEPPQYYVERNAIDKAEHAMRAMRGSGVVVKLYKLVYSVKKKQSKNALRELLRPHNRPSLVITTVETVFGSFSSVDLLIYYGPFILQSIGYEEYAAFSAPSVLAVIQVIAKAVGGLLVQWMGRRRTYFLAYLASIIPVVCLGLFFHLNPNKHHHLDPHHATISVVLVATHAVGNGLLLGPHGWLASTFPEECSDIGSTYALCLGLFISFVANNIFLHLLCLLREWIFFLFAGWTICVMFFALLLVPETTGIPQHELVRRVWRVHWFWRRFFPYVQEIELTRIA